jgi:acyl-CoA synthetase (NDP forming)
MPDAYISGVMLYRMIEEGTEVILGVAYDRTFGHMIMLGLGGICVEVLKDVSFRIAPISRDEAQDMVTELRSIVLLRGTRGEKPADIEAIVDGIMKISALVTVPGDHRTRCQPDEGDEQRRLCLGFAHYLRTPGIWVGRT